MRADPPSALFHPIVARWFSESYAEPTPAQRGGWTAIASGQHTLILAPTGSGKTLAAFLHSLNELWTRKEPFEPGVHTVYLSPLRALAADIERNLATPLREIRRLAERGGIELPGISTAMRTGDTPPTARRRMLRHPPHLLITTPESLHLLLTSPRAREILRSVRRVIVDEIHAVSGEKRGTFLAILLERLEALTASPPQRIGLSATQHPLAEIARYLGGYDRSGAPRAVRIVDAGIRRPLDLAVVSPVDDLSAPPVDPSGIPRVWPGVYERLGEWIDSHISTLIFANSRRTVERIAAELNRQAGHRLIRAHHGSVSKANRQRIEAELKSGTLPALVATSSLELGIDIGAIDLVCQVESPTSVAAALQRVGRAGHVFRSTSVGRMIPTSRYDLLRMAALVREMRLGRISPTRIPIGPLDVLAQQIVAMVAVDRWTAGALYDVIRRAYPYRTLDRRDFDAVLEMLSSEASSPGALGARPRILWERDRDRVEPLPGARQIAILNGGTIPDSGHYPMVLADGTTHLGELDEEFVFERRPGESFTLGTDRWRILEISHDRVVVAPSDDREAMMPFWRGEGLGHDVEFGRRFGAFLRESETHLDRPEIATRLAEECALDPPRGPLRDRVSSRSTRPGDDPPRSSDRDRRLRRSGRRASRRDPFAIRAILPSYPSPRNTG